MTNKLLLNNLSSVTSGVDLSKTCERKLLYCDKKMQKMEAELCILEAKLNSIAGLEEIKVEEKSQVEIPSPVRIEAEISSNGKQNPPSLVPNDKETVESQAAESESATPSAAKDPALAKYFKMVQFGVPVPAVKLKMQQEGFDPNMLDS